MPFKDLNNIPRIIDSSSNDMVNDFFIPVLKEASSYDRGVGYFTSGWLTSVAKGIVPLVEKGGKIRLLTSPYLEKRDYEAILLGDEAKTSEIIYKALSRDLEKLKIDLSEDARVALSWLVADRVLDIKIAIPRNKLLGDDFHVKFGIVKDEENSKILFMGSYNDTAHANINYEELAIFTSLDESSQDIISQKEVLFERIWNNEDPNIKTTDVPKAVIQAFEAFKQDKPRPYNVKNFEGKEINEKPHSVEGHAPWVYQNDAIDAWAKNNRRGILEMATGTGKTKTSLFALSKLCEEVEQLIVIIACPTKSLVSQWNDECFAFNLSPIICSSDNPRWKGQASDEVSKLNLQLKKYLTLVCTHETLKRDKFKLILDRVDKRKTKVLVIADECHHLGSVGSIDKIYREYDFTLGLSATPERCFDDAGTQFVEELLGPVIFKYTLRQAIQSGFLCPYEYYVHPVYLTEAEREDYIEISKRLKQLIAQNRLDDMQAFIRSDVHLSKLLNMRAKILKTAEMKLTKLREILTSREVPIEFAVIFCTPDTDELDKVSLMLKEVNIISHRFTGEEKSQEILRNFEQGVYKVLTAMNIFNEGIDVPVTKEAFIMSSSTNPTEYVQRRGRVLRKPKGINKEKAVIHDFIVLPFHLGYNDVSDIDKQIIGKEVNRAFLFAEDAMNGLKVMAQLNDILDKYIQISKK